MTITKGSLRDHMESRTNKAIKEVRDVMNKRQDQIRKIVEEKVSGLVPVMSKLSEITDKIEAMVTDYGVNPNDYPYYRYIRDLRDGTKIRGSIIEKEMVDIMQAIIIDKHYESLGLEDHIEKEKKIFKPMYEKVESIKKLHREIENVIAQANSGKQAYKNLVALGIDMEDFSETEAQLPAIQKLSVDPCIINKGGCN